MRKMRRQDSSFERAKKLIAEQTTLDEKSAEVILQAMLIASQGEQSLQRSSAQDERVKLAKSLLENYNKLRLSISSSISNTVDVLDDTEIQRLMQREDSVKNQQVRSLAMKSATSRVLFLQINSALDEMKNVCHNDPSPRFRRQYDVLYSRYIRGWSVEAVCTELHIERATFFRTSCDALQTFSIILFGGITLDCLVYEQPPSNNQEDCSCQSNSEQLKFF